uniref:Uncharacterized protein n=1 Tax=Anopheles epiroticus TaxID=199890 RepID=A0A182PCV8_9DIPT
MQSYKQTLSTEKTNSQLHPEWQTMCRICLQQLPATRSIFELDPETQRTYSEKVMQCVDVEIYPYDDLPNRICVQCIADLEVACRFRNNCTSSSVVLQSYLSYNGLADKQQPNLQLQPTTLELPVQADQDDGDEIAIHLDSGVMYTYKPPAGLDVKFIPLTAGDLMKNKVGNIHVNMKMSEEERHVDLAVEAETMPTEQPENGPSWEDGIILPMESVQESPNVEYLHDFIQEPETAAPTADDVTHVRQSVGVQRKPLNPAIKPTPHVSSGTQSVGKEPFPPPSSVKTLQTLRKTHAPNEAIPTIEAVTTHPASDDRTRALSVTRHFPIRTCLAVTCSCMQVCSVCGKRFTKAHHLKTHRNTHRTKHRIVPTDKPTDSEATVNELTNNDAEKDTTTTSSPTDTVVYTEMLQEELIATKDDERMVLLLPDSGVLDDGNGPGMIPTAEWTTMVNNASGETNCNGNATTDVVPDELENVSIVSFIDYIIKSDELDDLMVVQDVADDELVEMVG